MKYIALSIFFSFMHLLAEPLKKGMNVYSELSHKNHTIFINYEKKQISFDKHPPVSIDYFIAPIYEWKLEKSSATKMRNTIQIVENADTLNIPLDIWEITYAELSHYKEEKNFASGEITLTSTNLTLYTNLSYTIYALIFGILGLLSSLLWMRKRKQAAERQIQQDAERKAELEKMRGDLLEESERKTKLLIDDIHTGPLNKLALVNSKLNEIEEDSIFSKNIFSNTKHNLENLYIEIKRISRQLAPPELELGLDSAINYYLREEVRRMQPTLKIHKEIDKEGDQLQTKTRLMLYRIFQEAFNNIHKHAEATEVWVRFEIDTQTALLEIKDNGKGFEILDMLNKNQLGLSGIKARCEEINATHSLQSIPQKGTSLLINLTTEPYESLNS